MPRIIVEWLAGRSKNQRDTIAQEITDAFVKNAKVRPDQVTVVFKENLPELQYKGGESYKPIIKTGD
jgi:phenylpyruvate tautomerase PptA (4-oxalocrotonate tautomerase family)